MSARVLRMYAWTDESGEHVICESCGTLLTIELMGAHIDAHAQEPTHEGAGPLTLTGPRHAGGVESSGSPSFEPSPLGSPDGEAPPRSSSDAPPLMDGT